MLISEAKDLLKRNGFLVEAQEDIKLIDELNSPTKN